MKYNLISKVKKSLLSDEILKMIRHLISQHKNRNFIKNILLKKSNEEKFTFIFKSNYWGADESVSGPGSTIEYTENLRKELPNLFKKFSIRKVFDAPCGDFNWASQLLPALDIEWVGGDIVRSLIDSLNKKYKSEKVSFIHFDLIKEVPPDADLMICRDFLFHLSFEDTKTTLKNFLKSNIPYLLTTTHKNNGKLFVNQDIISGDFRLIDLFSNPYNFPENPLATIQDWIPPFPERQMNLWSREQIFTALSSMTNEKNTPHTLHRRKI